MLLADQAFHAIKKLLLTGAVRAGQMVSISELVERSGYPLAPVREAVKHAEALGLVRILPKRGVLVIEPLPTIVEECFHLRYLMDQEGARILANRADRSDLRALRQAHAEVRDEAGVDVTPELQRRARDVDRELHRVLANALNNALAERIYDSNHDRITVLQLSRRFLPERIISAMDEHLDILDSILAGDEGNAMKAVRSHFVCTLRWWGVNAPDTV
ncbi:GntR family transcriptional regulator [Castellaniella defragrans]|uniref:GntR family transcriptional regulator n=1 Tax=Castellaniella defragrans TaxID=75697 RepID=UPI002AFDE55A|nr:GntR family transcriptional regulator [Castellaniella defragrans]